MQTCSKYFQKVVEEARLRIFIFLQKTTVVTTSSAGTHCAVGLKRLLEEFLDCHIFQMAMIGMKDMVKIWTIQTRGSASVNCSVSKLSFLKILNVRYW